MSHSSSSIGPVFFFFFLLSNNLNFCPYPDCIPSLHHHSSNSGSDSKSSSSLSKFIKQLNFNIFGWTLKHWISQTVYSGALYPSIVQVLDSSGHPRTLLWCQNLQFQLSSFHPRVCRMVLDHCVSLPFLVLADKQHLWQLLRLSPASAPNATKHVGSSLAVSHTENKESSEVAEEHHGSYHVISSIRISIICALYI